MKHLFLIALIVGILFKCTSKVAGTIDDANSGIIGTLFTDNEKHIDDTVTVSLYALDTAGGLGKISSKQTEPFKTMIATDASYRFDSLKAGVYRVVVTKDDIIIGQQDSIRLESNETKTINITVVIIINQTFNISIDNSQDITINNFFIDNGKVEKADSGYILTSAETDTVYIVIEIEKDGEPDTITVQMVRDKDGISRFEVIESNGGITVTSGDGFTITIKETGTIRIEPIFVPPPAEDTTQQ
jgi:hypothetical protein